VSWLRNLLSDLVIGPSMLRYLTAARQASEEESNVCTTTHIRPIFATTVIKAFLMAFSSLCSTSRQTASKFSGRMGFEG